MDQFLPKSPQIFIKWELVWGKDENKLKVGDVDKNRREARVNSKARSSSENTPPWLLSSSIINHCKLPLQLRNRNKKSCIVIFLCKLNKVMLTKHLTLCPTHNMNIKMAALVIIISIAQERKALSRHWEASGQGGQLSEQEERDLKERDYLHQLCNYSETYLCIHSVVHLPFSTQT